MSVCIYGEEILIKTLHTQKYLLVKHEIFSSAAAVFFPLGVCECT